MWLVQCYMITEHRRQYRKTPTGILRLALMLTLFEPYPLLYHIPNLNPNFDS